MMKIKSKMIYPGIFLLYWINCIRAACLEDVLYIDKLQNITFDETFLETHHFGNFYEMEELLDNLNEYKASLERISTVVCEIVSIQDGIPYEGEDRNDVQSLEIIESTIPTLPNGTFSNFTKLSKLYLRNISIEVVEPGAFDGLRLLEELHLDHNAITNISTGVFDSLSHLKMLYLGHNRIQQIAIPAFRGLLYLKIIHLNSNNLTEFEHDSLFQTQNIEALDLSNNPIARAIQNVSFSPNLQVLLLNNVSLGNFDWDFSNYTMEKFRLGFNQIESFDVERLPKSDVLDLSHNRIISIIDWRFLQCTDLNFTHNLIEKIPGFYNNTMQTASGHLSSVNSLFQKLDFSHNSIAEIDQNAFENLTVLEHLYLEYNDLSVIPIRTFRNLPNLTHLNLAQNRIDQLQFGAFDSLESLQFFNISGNRLTVLNPFSFSATSKLSQLYFDDNQIESWSMTNAARHFKKLESVSFKGNRFSCEDLARILHESRDLKITISRGNFEEVENLLGIACYNSKSQNSTNQLQFYFDGDFGNSKFYRYFHGGYTNSSLFKFLDNYSYDTDSNSTYQSKLEPNSVEHHLSGSNNVEFFAIAVMQVMVVGILLVGIFSLFCATKRFLAHRRRLSNSSLQLL